MVDSGSEIKLISTGGARASGPALSISSRVGGAVKAFLLLHVLPFARDVPVLAANRMADIAVRRRVLAVCYVVFLFIVAPLLGVAILR